MSTGSSWGSQYDAWAASQQEEERRQRRRVELAERAADTEGEDSALDKQLGEDDPSEEELLKIAEGLSREGIIANLRLLKELLEDPDEDIAPEDQELFKQVFEEYTQRLQDEEAEMGEGEEDEELSSFLDEITEFHGSHDQSTHGKGGFGERRAARKEARKAARAARGPGATRKRLRSLKPSGLKSTWYKKGSAFQNEYNYGKYNWNYRPANVQEARTKRRKATASRARWRAATLLTLPLLAVGPYRRKMMGVLAVKKKNHQTAKRQHRSMLATQAGV